MRFGLDGYHGHDYELEEIGQALAPYLEKRKKGGNRRESARLRLKTALEILKDDPLIRRMAVDLGYLGEE